MTGIQLIVAYLSMWFSAAQLPNEAVFAGSQGSLTIHSPFHCATKFTSPAGTKEYPLPKPSMPLNFVNSTGMRWAEYVL